MTILYIALGIIVLVCLVGSSVKKARELERVKGRPATFGDFHEPAVYHKAYPIEDGAFLHYVKANGVKMQWRHSEERLDARPVWRDTPDGTIVGVALHTLDGELLAEQYRLLDA
jgi:hypothetical protein